MVNVTFKSMKFDKFLAALTFYPLLNYKNYIKDIKCLYFETNIIYERIFYINMLFITQWTIIMPTNMIYQIHYTIYKLLRIYFNFIYLVTTISFLKKSYNLFFNFVTIAFIITFENVNWSHMFFG